MPDWTLLAETYAFFVVLLSVRHVVGHVTRPWSQSGEAGESNGSPT